MKKYESPEVMMLAVMAKDVITLSVGESGNGVSEDFDSVFGL